ncbi:MAG TPA: DUF2269 family protein [Actinomycetota bacterium]
MDTYTTILLVIHIVGAIAGIGPTFAFSVLGKIATQGGDRTLFAMEAMKEINLKIVTPVAAITQPVTGALLIFKTGRDANFFKHEWLVMGIVFYLILMVLSYGPEWKRQNRMIDALKAGRGGSDEFLKDMRAAKAMGPVFGVLTLAIAVLMVWKPLDGA